MAFEDSEQNLRAPAQLLLLALLARQIARHHQSGLDHAAELPFHQFGAAQCGTEIVLRVFARKAIPQDTERQFLEASQSQKKSVIVDGRERVAADMISDAKGYDAGKCVVRAPANQRMERIVGAG